MKITVNGVEVAVKAGDMVNIVINVDSAGESLGPCNIEIRGGRLTIEGGAMNAVTIWSDTQDLPFLILRANEEVGAHAIAAGIPATP